MSLMCQRNSYLKEFCSSVRTIEPGECKIQDRNGKITSHKGFNVILNDTILFPEGGGQPDDKGMINEFNVLRVTRKGADAVHFVESELSINEKVKITLDWDRRFDHMQQHSGQHLITAIADKKYCFKTTSWDLGKTVSFIELDTKTENITESVIKDIENTCNDAIRNRVKVTVHVCEVGSADLQNVRARGLPDDHEGVVRIIDIENIDANMCCGTHVNNLSELMCIKLLSIEKGKKGKSNLYFLVGNRVLNNVERSYRTDKALTKHLKCGVNEHVEAVERTLKQHKAAQKYNTLLLREIAQFEAEKYLSQLGNGRNELITKHRKEGTLEYMNIIAKQLENCLNCYLFLSVGDEKGEGLFLIMGSDEFLSKCIENGAVDVLDGKGSKNNKHLQGKAKKMQNRKKALEIIKSCIPLTK